MQNENEVKNISFSMSISPQSCFKRKNKNKFPYVRDLKSYLNANFTEEEKIEKLAKNVNNFQFRNLQSAILECGERQVGI